MPGELECCKRLHYLISTVIHSDTKKVDLRHMREISDILNNFPNTVKQFIDAVKNKILQLKSAVSQYLLLDLIEFTTVKGTADLYKAYNSKSFLKAINTFLNDKSLEPRVRDKILHLVDFWTRFFKDRSFFYKNFFWYSDSIKSMGVVFPKYEESHYEAKKESTRSYNTLSGCKGDIEIDFNTKNVKLLRDLDVVVDDINLANLMIDKKELDGLVEVIIALQAIETKLKDLLSKIVDSSDTSLQNYVADLLCDIKNTRNRYKLMRGKRSVPIFTPKANNTLKEDLSNEVNTLKNRRSADVNSYSDKEILLYSPNDNDLLGLDVDDKPGKSFGQISNHFFPKNLYPYIKNAESFILQPDSISRSDTNNQLKSQTSTYTSSFKKQSYFVTCSTDNTNRTYATKSPLNFGFPENSNPIDLDFTKQTQDNVSGPVMQHEVKPHNPVDDIRYENPENRHIHEKPAYDPFADIKDFEL